MSKVTSTGAHRTDRRASRREFIQYGSLFVATTGLLLSGCSNDDEMGPDMPDEPEMVDLGSGDIGVLNYAYALEQLEAAFYTQVLQGQYYANASGEERIIMQDLQAHEVIHRDFLKVAINAASTNAAIADLEVDFSSIDFGSRASVLGAAKAFEDLGVQAYNGAGQLLSSADLLTLAGKIVSIEARHAAAIRSLLDSNRRSFAGDDIIDEQGLEITRTPAQVLMIASDFIRTPISAANLPR